MWGQSLRRRVKNREKNHPQPQPTSRKEARNHPEGTGSPPTRPEQEKQGIGQVEPSEPKEPGSNKKQEEVPRPQRTPPSGGWKKNDGKGVKGKGAPTPEASERGRKPREAKFHQPRPPPSGGRKVKSYPQDLDKGAHEERDQPWRERGGSEGRGALRTPRDFRPGLIPKAKELRSTGIVWEREKAIRNERAARDSSVPRPSIFPATSTPRQGAPPPPRAEVGVDTDQ